MEDNILAKLLVKNVNLIDGTGSDNVVKTNILIENNRFKSLNADISDISDA